MAVSNLDAERTRRDYDAASKATAATLRRDAEATSAREDALYETGAIEREVLAYLLDDETLPPHLSNHLLEDASVSLTPEDFHDAVCRAAYADMLVLHGAGQGADSAQVDAALRAEGFSADELAPLWTAQVNLAQAWNRKRFAGLARTVREFSARRQALAIAEQMRSLAADPHVSPDEMVAQAVARYRDIEARTSTGEDTLRDLVMRYDAQLDAWQADPGILRGTTTGLRTLDRMTHGLRRGHLTVIGGRASMGKTALLLSMLLGAAKAAQAAGEGHLVGLVSVEMAADDLIHRLASHMSHVPAAAIESGALTAEQDYRVRLALDELQALPLRIVDARMAVRRTNGARGQMTVAEVRRRVMLWQRDGILDAVGVDYLQLLRSPAEDVKLPRDERVDRNTQALRDVAVEANVPLIVLAQLSRETERRASHVPTLADLRESGGIEQTADAVWLLYRADYYRERGMELTPEADRPAGVTDVIVAKNRGGAVGKVSLYFRGDEMGFYDVDDRHGTGA